MNIIFYSGGENRIRTCDSIATIHAFQACAFNHSAISPCRNVPTTIIAAVISWLQEIN